MHEFELHNVTRYQALDAGGEVTILSQINTGLERGRLSALIGPSGGGKSTLLRLLNRLDEPDAGQIERRGKLLHSYPVRQLRRKVAFMPQQTTVFAGSLKDNLLLAQTFCLPGSAEFSQHSLNAILERVGLSPHLLDRAAADLSGGERQRLALARLLLAEPEVLLLDEPASALDPPAREQLGQFLRKQVEAGISVIFSSHDMAFVRRFADNFLFLSKGQIRVAGKIAGLEQVQDPEFSRFLNAEGEPC